MENQDNKEPVLTVLGGTKVTSKPAAVVVPKTVVKMQCPFLRTPHPHEEPAGGFEVLMGLRWW